MGNPFTNESDAAYEAREAEERNADRAATDVLRECVVGGCHVLVEEGPWEALCDRHRGLTAPQECRVCDEPGCETAVRYGGRCKLHHTKSTSAEALPDIAPPPLPEQRPLVRHGDVAAMLFNELRTMFARIQQLEAFEQHVMNAAKSPAAWLQLRQELAK